MKNDINKFIVSLVLAFLPGIIGTLFTTSSINTWYQYLNKPALNPPGYIFGPVWTLLYILIGISFFLVWKNSSNNLKAWKMSKWIFSIQLILNGLWSLIFFGAHMPGLALINIVLLWISILWMIKVFYRISKISGYILIPYLIWVSFATYLNYSIYISNLPLLVK